MFRLVYQTVNLTSGVNVSMGLVVKLVEDATDSIEKDVINSCNGVISMKKDVAKGTVIKSTHWFVGNHWT